MPTRPGYTTLSPYLATHDCAAAIDWYGRHLGATERYRLALPDGRIAHAELQIGDTILFVSDEFPDMGIVSPKTLGGSPCSINIYVDDVDAVFAAMLADGAEQSHGIEDHFHGDRSGKLKDPFGHLWHVASSREPLGPDQIVERFRAMMGV